MGAMKITLLSLLGAAVAACAAPVPNTTPVSLDESEVRISYAELKRLLAAAQPVPEPPAKPVPPPPVAAALLSATYRLESKSGLITAEMQAQSFVEGWQAIPLAGASLGAVQIEPPDARVVVQNDQLCLLTDKPSTSALTLTFPFTAPLTLRLAPSAIAAFEVDALPDGQWLQLRMGTKVVELRQAGRVALPADGSEITLAWADDAKPSVLGIASDDAILTAATYTTEVVRDGSVLTEGSLIVRHDPPLRISISLPADSQLLQCHVNGELIRPVIQNGTELEIPLDDPTTDGGESKIDLSFTSTLTALQATEGEVALALPRTPLFAKQIDWHVQFPAGFELVSSGNLEVLAPSADAKPGLHLRKSLCRNQQPETRLTYRKRSAN